MQGRQLRGSNAVNSSEPSHVGLLRPAPLLPLIHPAACGLSQSAEVSGVGGRAPAVGSPHQWASASAAAAIGGTAGAIASPQPQEVPSLFMPPTGQRRCSFSAASRSSAADGGESVIIGGDDYFDGFDADTNAPCFP